MKPLAPDDLDYVATRAQRAFDHLNYAHVLITGSTGFVGSWLRESGLDHCNHEGVHIRLSSFSRTKAEVAGTAYSWFGDEPVDIREIVLPPDVTHVLHCANAGSADENRKDPDAVCDMITKGTSHVARECARVGARLLVMSSGSVYDTSTTPVNEDAPIKPRDVFGAAKFFAEQNALEANPNTVIARGFAMLGPRLPLQFAAAEFVAQALDPGYLTVHGTGATVRSYLYAADLAAYLWHLLAFGESGQAYNVGSDSPTTIGTLACHVAHASGLDPDRAIKWGKPSKDSPPFVPSTAKLRHLLGTDWLPPLTPLESLERWIRWERSSATPTTLSR